MVMTAKRATHIATILLHAESRRRSDVDVFDQLLALEDGIPTPEEWMFVGKSIAFETSPVFIAVFNALRVHERHGEKPRPRLTDAYIKRKVAQARAAATCSQEQADSASPVPPTRSVP